MACARIGRTALAVAREHADGSGTSTVEFMTAPGGAPLQAQTVHGLLALHGCAEAEACLLLCKPGTAGPGVGDTPLAQDHIVVLCDAAGTPLESRYLPLAPEHAALTRTCAVVASSDALYLWQYSSVDAGAPQRTQKERVFELTGGAAQGGKTAADAITCIAAGGNTVLVGRESGLIHAFALPSMALTACYVLPCRPAAMSLNCTATRCVEKRLRREALRGGCMRVVPTPSVLPSYCVCVYSLPRCPHRHTRAPAGLPCWMRLARSHCWTCKPPLAATTCRRAVPRWRTCCRLSCGTCR
jgi:hypothetical protein